MIDELDDKLSINKIYDEYSDKCYSWGIKNKYIDSTYMFYKDVISKLDNKKEYLIDRKDINRIDANNIIYKDLIVNLHLIIELFRKDNIGVIFNDFGFKVIDRKGSLSTSVGE